MILGITGKARAGKDTFARVMKNRSEFHKAIAIHAFAHELKCDCQKLGFTLDELYNNKTDVSRRVMQRYGTEIRRAEDPEYWIHRLVMNTGFIRDITTFPFVMITDVRFENEADFIHRCGGTIVRIERPDHLRDLIEHGIDHASETEQERIKCDFSVMNNSTFNALCHKGTEILTELSEGSTE